MKEALNLRTVGLIALIISYFVVAGADIFAQVAIAWTVLEAPPRSLSMFQGEYVYDSSTFWSVTTSLTLILFVFALVVNWRTPRRQLILISFIGYFIINIVSFAYIFPEYLDIVSSAYSDTIDPELQRRGAAWQWLALVRWGVVVAFGVLQLLALAQPSSAESEKSEKVSG